MSRSKRLLEAGDTPPVPMDESRDNPHADVATFPNPPTQRLELIAQHRSTVS